MTHLLAQQLQGQVDPARGETELAHPREVLHLGEMGPRRVEGRVCGLVLVLEYPLPWTTPLEGSSGGQQVQTDPSAQTGVVRLLQTVKIPAGYGKIGRGRVHGGVGEEMVLFTSTMAVPALQMADSALDAGDQEYATLVLENHGTEKVELKKGTVLGTIVPVEKVQTRSIVPARGDVSSSSLLGRPPESVDETALTTAPYVGVIPDSPGVDSAEAAVATGSAPKGAPSSTLTQSTREEIGTLTRPPADSPILKTEVAGRAATQTGGGVSSWDPGDPAHSGEQEVICQIQSEPDGRTRRLLEQLELESQHLTSTQQTQLVTLLQSFTDVFALDSSELGATSVTQHSIDTGGHPPIRQPMRRMPRVPTPVDQGSQLGARRKSDEQGNKWDGRLRRRQSGTSTEDGRS